MSKSNDPTEPELELFQAPAPHLVQMEDEPDADFITRVRERLDDEAQLDRDTKLAESVAESLQDSEERFYRLFDSDTAAGYEGQGSD